MLTSDQHRRLDEAIDAGLRIVSFFFGDPAYYVEQVHDANRVVLHTVGSADEARRAVASGVDVIVAQGWEAGGHVRSQVATLPLVPAVVDAVAPVPVIAAGGIGDARGVAAVLALGAQAAWLGTRFLLAQEMPIHEHYRRRLLDAAETDAQRYPDLYEVGWPKAPHRALRNSTSEAWEAAGRPPLGTRPGDGDVIAHFASGESIVRYEPAPPMVGTTGDIEALSMWAGQSVALAHQPQPSAGSRQWRPIRPATPGRDAIRAALAAPRDAELFLEPVLLRKRPNPCSRDAGQSPSVWAVSTTSASSAAVGSAPESVRGSGVGVVGDGDRVRRPGEGGSAVGTAAWCATKTEACEHVWLRGQGGPGLDYDRSERTRISLRRE